ncbi:MAG: helix-turn-helix transcriptional regulator [Planctomycetota bacterium]|jgi:DNA-binding phage protein|nr:helix-turn-helix transcriptional regulator [Planctomycetota bacterium]
MITTIGQAIEERRRILALTQARVAELAGLSRRGYQAMLRGNPQLETLTAVCQVLGLEIEVRVRQPQGGRLPQPSAGLQGKVTAEADGAE